MRLIIKLIKFLEDLTLLTLRIFPAETAKNITLRLLKLIYNLNLISLFASGNIKKSKINIKNLSLKNRIGIAGGLDKNAEYFHIFSSLGFGFVEVGTVTLEPQTGNPKPRIFRFTKDKTLINSISTDSLNQKARRPLKTNLNLSKAKKRFNYQPKSFREGLRLLDEQIKKIKLKE